MTSTPPAMHPLNLGLRFALELAALVAVAVYGWGLAGGALRFAVAAGLPLLLAALWGTFAVPGDPSRSGNAPVPVPGIVRLALELAILGFGLWALYRAVAPSWAAVHGGLTALHYLLSRDRVVWLIGSR